MNLIRFLAFAALSIPAFVAAQAPPAGASPKAVAAFRTCDAEGFMALNIGRNYMLGKRDRETVLPYVRGSAFAQQLAYELFDRVDKGDVQHYADFATEKLQDCALREGMDLQVSMTKARTCYARTDIPFFLHGDLEAGESRQAAQARTATRLKDRDVYPQPLINAVGEAVYTGGSAPDLRKLMGTVFWSCMYNEAWRRP